MLYASWEKAGEPWSTPLGIKNELRSRGHDVRHYNLYHDDGVNGPPKLHYSNQGINLLLQDFNRSEFVPDAIFCMDYGPWDALQFDKAYFPGVVLLKEAGDEPQAHRAHLQAAPRVHVMLSPDRQCVDRYNQYGYHAVYWTHFADTRIFYPRPDVSIDFDCVTTCGSRGGGLTEDIQKALGGSFNNERYFYGDDYGIRLNMGNMVFQCSQFKEVTRRIFEGMGCGKLVITDRLPEETGLSEMFVEGRDIVYYDDAQDAIAKIKMYAEQPEEMMRVAKSGYDKVMAEHTQVQRCDMIESCVEAARETMLV